MAIGTYSELQTACMNWLERPDLEERVPEFIALFEGRARRELRSWLKTKLSVTNVTGDYTVAATVEAVEGVAYNDGIGGTRNHPLDLISFEDYHARMSVNSAVRSPSLAAYIERDESANTTVIRFYPPCSAASPIANLVLDVVGYLPALSDSATTNRLLSVAPDLYLFGSLAESAPYLSHDERIQTWESRMWEGFKGLKMQTERKQFSGNRPARLPVVFG